MRIKVVKGRHGIAGQPADYSGGAVKCPNSSWVGTCTTTAKPGCWLTWRDEYRDDDGGRHGADYTGRMFAKVENWAGSDKEEPSIRIAVIAIDNMGSFGMLRWVDPKRVTRISEEPPKKFLAWITGEGFEKAAKEPDLLLRLLNHGSLCEDFIEGAEDVVAKIKERRLARQQAT